MHVLQSGLFLTLDFGVSEGSVVQDGLRTLVYKPIVHKGG